MTLLAMNRRRLLRARSLILVFCLFGLPRKAASTDIYLQIQRGEKTVIALPDFISKKRNDKNKAVTNELHETAKQDILFTHLFNLIEEGPPVKGGRIDFETWGKNGADLLVTANVKIKKDKKRKGKKAVQMIASLFELPGGKPIFQKIYLTGLENSRRLAHEFVSDIIFRFTGNRGVSQSRIVFSNDATGHKELYLIDYDGKNLKRLTSDKSLVLLPKWTPDKKGIIYTSYRNGNPDLLIRSLSNGKFKTISSRQGLNTSASFSPDGKKIVITLSYQGSPSLYLLDWKGSIIRRLTRGRYADTSSSFSADGRKIVFVSDRPGWPQIYMMDTDGSNVKRITNSGYCDSPVWSPLGDKIAYSRGTKKGKHDIIIHDLASGKAFQLTQDSGNNENPSFSPDGRFIVFTTTRNKKRELFIVSVDGTIQKKLADIPGDSFTPSWEP